MTRLAFFGKWLGFTVPCQRAEAAGVSVARNNFGSSKLASASPPRPQAARPRKVRRLMLNSNSNGSNGGFIKLQTPTSKLQRRNTKHQAPNSRYVPSSKHQLGCERSAGVAGKGSWHSSG